MRRFAAAVVVTLLSSPALAKDPPTPPPELVVQAPDADAATLTRRALVCIPQTVQPGFTDAPTILSSDVEGGLVVANNAFDYEDRGWGLLTVMRGRTKLTFEARPGRFRLSHTPAEVFVANNWRPVAGKWVNQKLDAINQQVAQCVTKAAESSANW